jgi:hypothetical protein
MQTKTIEYRNRVELYEVSNGLETFLGYVHTCNYSASEAAKRDKDKWVPMTQPRGHFAGGNFGTSA